VKGHGKEKKPKKSQIKRKGPLEKGTNKRKLVKGSSRNLDT